MTNTDNLSYPIMLFSQKLFILKFKKSPQDLIWEKGSLKRLSYLKGLSVIDNSLQEYQVIGTKIVRGHGFLSGYFFQGPFLARNVIFRADLKFAAQLDLKSAAELIIEFMRGAQSLRENDIARFREAFASFLPGTKATLASLYSFYSSFRWGDDLEPED